MVTGRALVLAPPAVGPLLMLQAPLSFWGGVDAATGRISDPRHPDFGRSITGVVLALPSAIGSSSSSAIMLELLREGTAPVALLMGTADAILALGVVVGRELDQDAIPVLEVPWPLLAAVPSGTQVRVSGATVSEVTP